MRQAADVCCVRFLASEMSATATTDLYQPTIRSFGVSCPLLNLHIKHFDDGKDRTYLRFGPLLCDGVLISPAGDWSAAAVSMFTITTTLYFRPAATAVGPDLSLHQHVPADDWNGLQL